MSNADNNAPSVANNHCQSVDEEHRRLFREMREIGWGTREGPVEDRDLQSFLKGDPIPLPVISLVEHGKDGKADQPPRCRRRRHAPSRQRDDRHSSRAPFQKSHFWWHQSARFGGNTNRGGAGLRNRSADERHIGVGTTRDCFLLLGFSDLRGGGTAGAKITPVGDCVVIARNVAVPTADKWAIAPVPGSSVSGSFVASAYLLDETNGAVIQCSTVETPTNNGSAAYVNGACAKFSPNLTP